MGQERTYPTRSPTSKELMIRCLKYKKHEAQRTGKTDFQLSLHLMRACFAAASKTEARGSGEEKNEAAWERGPLGVRQQGLPRENSFLDEEEVSRP